MRVVVDCTGSMSANTGGATYASAMLPRWERQGKDELTAVFSHGQVPEELSSLSCIVELPLGRLPGANRIVDLHLGVRRVIAQRRADVAYFPGNFVPLGLPEALPVVVAIRSTIHFDLPAQCGVRRAAAQRLAARYATRRSQRIIVPSSKTADLLMHHTGAQRRQLVVVAHGVDLETFSPGEADERHSSLLLFVSKPWDYKGLHTVLRALRELMRARPVSPPQLLVVDGGLGQPDLDRWRLACDAFGVGELVRFTGRADRATLARLYRRASALVLPSATESFGNPFLEAAAAGCLVVGPSGLALDDILGHAALRVPAHDHVTLASAMRRALDMDAAQRAENSMRLRTIAEAFPWDKTLERTREVLLELA